MGLPRWCKKSFGCHYEHGVQVKNKSKKNGSSKHEYFWSWDDQQMHADGKGGNDLMEGSDFNDTLIGGDGYDHIDTQEGKNNKATGGKGKDWFFVDSEDLEDSHVTITDFNRKQKDKIAWEDDRSDYDFKIKYKKGDSIIMARDDNDEPYSKVATVKGHKIDTKKDFIYDKDDNWHSSGDVRSMDSSGTKKSMRNIDPADTGELLSDILTSSI